MGELSTLVSKTESSAEMVKRQPGRFQDSIQVEMMEEDFIQKIKELKCCLVGGVGEQ